MEHKKALTLQRLAEEDAKLIAPTTTTTTTTTGGNQR